MAKRILSSYESERIETNSSEDTSPKQIARMRKDFSVSQVPVYRPFCALLCCCRTMLLEKTVFGRLTSSNSTEKRAEGC